MNTTTQYLSSSSGDILSIIAETKENFANLDTDIDTIKWGIQNNLMKPKFRIYVLYPDETINYEIPVEDIKIGGSYSENYQNGQRRSLSFTLYNQDGKYTPDIDTFWSGTRLRLDMGLEAPNQTIYWFKKGVFIIDSATPSLTPTGRSVNISASDKFKLFESGIGTLSTSYEVEAGTNIQTLIQDIIKTEMGNSYPIDPQDLIYNAAFAGKKTQVKISKNAGDTLGSILLDLATQLSAEIFYNSSGNLVLIPIDQTTQDQNKPLVYNFETVKGDISQLDFTLDYNTIINKVVVIGNSNAGVYMAERKNDDPASPLCGKRIGYRLGNVINDSNIYSQVLADERADYELRQQLILKSTTSATVALNPFLEVNNVITISDDFYDLVYERFLLQSVSCSLDFSNTMSISFSNLNNLPFVV